jgi:hypothetical protein
MNAAPEIILPRKRSALSDEALDQIATVLDECFRIPGTRVRIGIDAVVGLIPGLGDFIGGVLSLIFVVAAFMRGLPKVAILRMVVNIGIDVLVGAIPFAGDAFDAWWKVNRRNYNLLMRHQRTATPGREVVRDWVFLLLIMLATSIVLTAPMLVFAALVYWLRK